MVFSFRYIENNRLTQITSTTFLNHGSVQIMDLSGNGIKSIAKGVLDALTDLTYL
jgi:Leucine-rich repeat (LRR) protein